MKSKSKILIIAGSDSSGGAGIQADIKTVTSLGSYAMTAITAVTSQNTKDVLSIIPIPKNEISKHAENVKGEFVMVMEGKTLKNSDSDTMDIYDNEIKKLLSKFSLTDVVQIVHKLTGIKKNKVYKWVLSITKL